MSYYDRKPLTLLDGTPIFKSLEDEENEKEVAVRCELAWGCTLRSLGQLALIDWVAEREHRPVGLVELKTTTSNRQHAWLNFRKWIALTMGVIGFGIPAAFVYRWPDEIRWIFLHEVDATAHRVKGTSRIVKSRNDREPVVLIPRSEMKVLP